MAPLGSGFFTQALLTRFFGVKDKAISVFGE